MRTPKDISDAAAIIAAALDGFDAADADKAIAAVRALRGEQQPATYVPVFAPPYQPPAYDPQPWGGWPQIVGTTFTAYTGVDSTVCGGTVNYTFGMPLGVALNAGNVCAGGPTNWQTFTIGGES